MKQAKTIYKGHVLFTPSLEAFQIVENGYIAVDENGKVEGVYAEIPAQMKDWELVDFGNKLLIPGVYDLHVHAPQYRNQGMAMDLELLPWLQTYTFPEESKYKDLAYAKVMYSHFVKDMLREGTARAAVFATIHPEATKLLAHLFDEAGMGAMIGLVAMNQNGPDTLANTVEEAVRDTMAVVDEVKDMPRVEAIVTPRFVPSCTSDMLAELGKLAAAHHLPVQSHLSENHGEIAWVKDLEPEAATYGDAYHRYGLLGQTPTLMAHCVYTDGDELEQIKQNAFDSAHSKGVMIVHCPTSNCNVASGVAPIRKFLDAGIPVALGSDISGGHHLSIFRVMQYAQQMSKLKYAESNGQQSFLSLSEVFYLGTKSGGSFFGKVGSFEPGYAFDALVIDDAALNVANAEAGGDPYTLLQRLERFIYLGDERMISDRFIDGNHLPAM